MPRSGSRQLPAPRGRRGHVTISSIFSAAPNPDVVMSYRCTGFKGWTMSDLSDLLDTPEKILIAAGTACVIVSIIAPAKVLFVGVVQWTARKQVLLGAVGCVLLACGVSLKWLPPDLFFNKVPEVTGDPAPAGNACEIMQSPNGTQPETSIDFINASRGTVQLYWINNQCALKHYYDLGVSERLAQKTYVGDRWLVTDYEKRPIAVYVATKERLRAVIRN